MVGGLHERQLAAAAPYDESPVARDHARPGIAELASLPLALSCFPIQALERSPGPVNMPVVDDGGADRGSQGSFPDFGCPLQVNFEFANCLVVISRGNQQKVLVDGRAG